MKLSEKIRILRKARGLSQEEFGYSHFQNPTDGVSRQTVSDWENGKFEPKLDNIRDIARVLDVSFDVLLDEFGRFERYGSTAKRSPPCYFGFKENGQHQNTLRYISVPIGEKGLY